MSNKKESEMIEPPVLTSDVRITVNNNPVGGIGAADGVKPGKMQSMIKVGEDDDELSYVKLKKYIEDNHPRKEPHKSKYTCCEVCGATSGWHYCCTTSNKSEMDRFGVGVVLYFRFVKYLIGFFLLFAILSIPALYFSIRASMSFVNDFSDYKSLLYYTTLGSIGRGASQCKTANIGDTITIKCEKGTIGRLSALQYGFVEETQDITCDYYTYFSWTRDCNNFDQSALEAEYSNCLDQPSCQFTIRNDFFTSQGKCWLYKMENRKVYVRALCENIEIELPGGKTIEKERIAYIIGGCDAAICVLFFFFIITLKQSEASTIDKVVGSVNSVEDYTIEVRNLPKMKRDKLRRSLWTHFSQVKHGKKIEQVHVMDVQFAEPQILLSLQVRHGTLKVKRIKMSKAFYKKWAKERTPSKEISMEDLDEIAKKSGKKARKEYNQIAKVKKNEIKIENKINNLHNQKGGVVCAYITFENKLERDKVLRGYDASQASGFFYKCCSSCFEKDQHNFHGKYLRVSGAPSPSNINWANMDASSLEKFLRRVISWLITICLWAITLAFIAWIKDQQAELAKDVRPNLDCRGVNPTRAEVDADQALGASAIGLLECYCRYDTKRQFNEEICREWAWDRYKTIALPFVIVFAIILTNFIMQYIFKALASFEKHRNATTELSSRVLKIFVAQFLNTGVIILIVNIKFSRNPKISFLDGNYDDFIPEWYLNVGTTLLTTMIINIISLPIANILVYLMKSCFRCWDRGCSNNMEKTKKKTQEAWNRLYTGPDFMIDFRYSQILTVVFICFLYGAGLPLLYFSTVLNLIIIYWLDKFFLLKICKTPKKFDHTLEENVGRALYVILLIHLIFAVWVYGNPQIFGSGSTFGDADEILDKVQRSGKNYALATIANRASRYQNIALTVLFFGFIAILLLRFFLKNTLVRCWKFCCGKRLKQLKAKSNKYKAMGSYYELIKYDDLVLERKYLLKELSNPTMDEELKKFLQHRLERIEFQIKSRNQASGDKMFQGLFSYYIGHNNVYKDYINVEGTA